MAEREVLDAPGTPATEEPGAPSRLLTRLNRRGFRLVMLADVLALLAVAVVTMIVRFGFDWPSYPVPLYLLSFAVATALFVGSFYFGGLYEREPRLGSPPVLPRVARQTLGAGGLVALLTLALTGLSREVGLTTARALPFPIVNLVVFIVVGAIAAASVRRLALALRTRREGPPKAVLLGSEDAVRTARRHLDVASEVVRVVGEARSPEQLLEVVHDTDATDAVVLSGQWLDELYPNVLLALERAGVTVLLRVSARETMYGLERIREVAGLPFVLLRAQTIPRSRARFKRAFDLVLLLALAPLALPVLALTALYQRIVAGPGILFWQERVGAGGHVFRMVKFRTMSVDAENDGRGARLAEADDPRVIRACRWIRATRLDELPQLYNVLRGEMSIVGPRPERPELTAEFERAIPGYARRHEVPPGLTGLAQIHGRYHTDAEYKLGYDLQYLVNWSPVLDLEILARTVFVVLARRV